MGAEQVVTDRAPALVRSGRVVGRDAPDLVVEGEDAPAVVEKVEIAAFLRHERRW